MYQFFADAGHGWLKVPIEELEKLDIQNKISGCSYMRNNFAYLEEDGDVSLFADAKGISPHEFNKNIKLHSSNHSTIRSYNSYDYEQYQALKQAINRYNNEDTLRKWVNHALNDKSHTKYFADKTHYDQLSYAAKTWFYNIAKTIQQEALNAAQVWLKLYEPYDTIKIPKESKLHEKLKVIKKEIEVLA